MAISRKKGSTAHNPETRRKPKCMRAKILLTPNLRIRNAAIYSALVVHDIVIVG